MARPQVVNKTFLTYLPTIMLTHALTSMAV